MRIFVNAIQKSHLLSGYYIFNEIVKGLACVHVHAAKKNGADKDIGKIGRLC